MVQVKKNQINLYNSIKERAEKQVPIDSYEQSEHKRGRNEIRIVEIFQADQSLSASWTSLNTLISVKRTSIRKGKKSCENSYYISSLVAQDAQYFACGIRSHWSIENRLHWVKDVMQGEDKAGIRKGNGIETLSIFRSIAINISRAEGYDSIKEAQIYFASNVKELIKILRT